MMETLEADLDDQCEEDEADSVYVHSLLLTCKEKQLKGCFSQRRRRHSIRSCCATPLFQRLFDVFGIKLMKRFIINI